MGRRFTVKHPRGFDVPFEFFNANTVRFGYSDGYPDEWGIDIYDDEKAQLVFFNSHGIGQRGRKLYRSAGHVVASKFGGGKRFIRDVNVEIKKQQGADDG